MLFYFFFLYFLRQGLSVAKANTELLVLLSAKIMRLKACTTISGREFYSPPCDGLMEPPLTTYSLCR